MRLTIPLHLQDRFAGPDGKPRKELSPVNLQTFDKKEALAKGALIWASHKAMLEKIDNGQLDTPSVTLALRTRYENELVADEETVLSKITDGEKKLLRRIEFLDLSIKASRNAPEEANESYLAEKLDRERQLSVLRLKRHEILNEYKQLKSELSSPEFAPVFFAEASDLISATTRPPAGATTAAWLKSVSEIARDEALSVISSAIQGLEETNLSSTKPPLKRFPNCTETTPNITLSEYYETVIKPSAQIKTRRGEVGRTPSGFEMHKEGVRYFTDVMGNMKIGEITSRHVKEFAAVYSLVPKHWGKRADCKGKTLREIIRIADQTTPPPPRLAPETVNSVITGLRCVLGHAVEKEHLVSNPASGVSLSVANDKDRQPAFTIQELNFLFKSPLFTGCASDSDFDTPGNHLIRDHRFWAHFCLLFTGARVGEIGGIEARQVTIYSDRDGGYFEFDWTDGSEGRSLKNPTSTRRVPIHPELIKLGFADYVKAIQSQGHKRLFPEWIPNRRKHEIGYTNQYSSVAWIKRFKRSNIWKAVQRKGLSLKSYRACFETATYGTTINERTLLVITGRTHNVKSTRNYKSTLLKAEQLESAMSSIQFEGLEIDHLYKN